ncbi:right-handed parallel beta-helix repeat-containing protein [Spirosoma soli]|uniref:Right-handed parallel beta-helix repeat-containing protein n=1 Tax=Spirosoma soli TaxID=1770529 RepID=A0ABW5LZ10_9BACT
MLLILVTFTLGIAQKTYYLAANGNDTNNGLSVNAPFRTLTRVNKLLLQPGDTLLLRRGDTFRGSLQIRQSGSSGKPIVVDAYGSGRKPILSGSVPVTGWKSLGSNRWQAVCKECGDRVTGLFKADSALPLGRYPNLNDPNKGYLTVQSHSGATQLTSQQPLTNDWTGGEAVIRPTQWILDRTTITKQTGNTLLLNNKSSYAPTDGFGYFIQNHPAALDQPGEWCYNPADQTIKLYANKGNPNALVITATILDKGIELTNASFIVIRNLHITQTLSTGLYISNASSFTVTGNDITSSGEDGVTIVAGGKDVLIENNRVIDANNNGFLLDSYHDIIVRGNEFRRMGLIPGRGRSGDGQYNGVRFGPTLNALIENNRIDSVGFNGLSFMSDVMIQHNVISNYCMTKTDGGGIYSWNANKLPTQNIHIVSNIIYNGIGAPEGTLQNGHHGTNGVFLDDCMENVDLINNTVFSNRGWGIFMRGDHHINVLGNTFFDNADAQFVMYHNGGFCPFRENVVKQNIFFSKSSSQLVARYESNTDDLDQYGLLDYNYYVRPFADVFTIRAVYNWWQVNEVTLDQWRNRFKQDANAKNSPLTYPEYTVKSVNPKLRINTDFAKDGQGWSTWSPYNNGQAIWDPKKGNGNGSLCVTFPTPTTATNSYVLVTKDIGSVTKSRSFLLRFDAIASADKKIQVFIRQRDAPYQDLDKRFNLLVGPTRQHYEIAFTASADEANALLTYQLNEDGQSVWFDNIQLQEATITPTNTDDHIRLVYNPTLKDSLVTLPGRYRDVRNRYYDRQVRVPPFRSVILLTDSLPPIDLSLKLRTDKQALQVGEVTSFSLTVRNDRPSKTTEQAQWTCRLPPNLEVVSGAGLQYSEGVLTGTVQNLLTDTTFVFQAKSTVAGTYKTAAQVTTTTHGDPDSTPDSGTSDGEDDTATATFRVGEPNDKVFSSPNPGQMILPSLVSTPASVDLSLRMALSSRTPAYSQTVTCTIWVNNTGESASGAVQIQNLLPAGLRFAGGTGWTANGNLLITNLTDIPAGKTISVSFQARVVGLGQMINQAQISTCATSDIDSTPGNGFGNGEDDQVQADFRVRLTNGGSGIFSPD